MRVFFFADWILSEEDKSVIGKKLGRTPARKGFISKYTHPARSEVTVQWKAFGPLCKERLEPYSKVFNFRRGVGFLARLVYLKGEGVFPFFGGGEFSLPRINFSKRSKRFAVRSLAFSVLEVRVSTWCRRSSIPPVR
jgi:hypothetical protein